ncbi:phage tail assembly chaperone [Pseudomonas sp. 10S4]|uniref:phage tail assembly chaperone n=1 Tax=Pseudomonas sp. 10S4 TaxID=3048583 RepID=UPI002AC8A5C1|nr:MULTISPECIES: phage tail assembly chaperone [unclassified Pseudomonas]MEB0223647.1 phage tail assembly chaperone [Pseudomonas sp. 5S1]MEB0297142.1 phage tail assembly chaperone [Pseudomonas sp. 10S4]WPX21083.1 phage tail assembly chaperone [Pseudomonas sp. 10S4]
MAMYARVENGVAVELIDTGDYAIAQLFAPSFVTSMVRVPDGVDLEVGSAISSVNQDLVPPPVLESALAIDTSYASSEETAEPQRAWRQATLSNSQWLLNRHRDEQELGRVTTLTVPQYLALLEYRQALRDWPTCANFPTAISRPKMPDWLAQATGADSKF